MKRFVLFMTLVLVSCGAIACGASGYGRDARSANDEPPGSVEEYRDRIAGMQRELGLQLGFVRPDGQSVQSASPPRPETGPDCGAAGDLRDRICELAERICKIAARDPDERGIAATCNDARKSCAEARADVARACER